MSTTATVLDVRYTRDAYATVRAIVPRGRVKRRAGGNPCAGGVRRSLGGFEQEIEKLLDAGVVVAVGL